MIGPALPEERSPSALNISLKQSPLSQYLEIHTVLTVARIYKRNREIPFLLVVNLLTERKGKKSGGADLL